MPPKVITLTILLVALGAVAGPGSSGQREGGVAGSTDTLGQALVLHDWIGWDRTLYRTRLAGLNRYAWSLPIHPWQEYQETVRYKAPVDSLGWREFQALPAAERRARQDLAKEYRDKAERFIYLVTDMVAKVQADPDGAMQWVNPPGIGESLTRCLGYLATANGVDPTRADAWYDLAFLTAAVGDGERQARCLDAALTALQDEQSDVARALRHRLFLDEAWLCRDHGLPDQGLVWVNSAESLLGRDQESTLLKGLMTADLGQYVEACRLAEDLRSLPVEKLNWGPGPTDFAERWIQSVAYRAEGNLPLASFALGRVHSLQLIPYAKRYYNDVGLLCELNGQPGEAREYYGLAAANNPLFLYYPVSSYQGHEQVHGQPAGFTYFVAYNRFYVGGSLFSYAADLVLELEAEQDPGTRTELAHLAIDALSQCRQRLIEPASALALRGRVFYYLEDHENAYSDMSEACQELVAVGRGDAESFALAGMLALELGHDSAAADYLQRSLAYNPDQPAVWRAVGVALLGEGDLVQGKRALDRAVRLDPESAVAWYNRGLMNFHDRQWDVACADLKRASELAPNDDNIARLLARARKERDGESAAGTELAAGAERAAVFGTLTPPQSSAFLREQLAATFVQDPQVAEPDEEMSPGTDLSRVISALGQSGEPSWLTVGDQQIARIVDKLEEDYADNPTRNNRRDLALAYVRAGQADKGRQMLLPLWPRDLEPDEACIVLEADRALGDVERARQLAESLVSEPPPVKDATFWSLVASICLDFGLNQDGMAALDAAIDLDPDNQALKSHRQLLSPGR